jgi:hypothetical protein
LSNHRSTIWPLAPDLRTRLAKINTGTEKRNGTVGEEATGKRTE